MPPFGYRGESKSFYFREMVTRNFTPPRKQPSIQWLVRMERFVEDDGSEMVPLPLREEMKKLQRKLDRPLTEFGEDTNASWGNDGVPEGDNPIH